MSERTVRVLDRHGTDLAIVPTERSSKRAVSVARRGLASLRDEAPVGVSLARATVRDYGTMRPGHPERLDLVIEDRLVWVVVFDGFTQQPAGPIPTGEPSRSRAVPPPARIVHFVNAHTDEWLRAETV